MTVLQKLARSYRVPVGFRPSHARPTSAEHVRDRLRRAPRGGRGRARRSGSETTRAAAPPVDRAELAARVKAELLHSWRGYERYAWGHDELLPVSKTRSATGTPTPLLMTPVDALDTLLLMGLPDEAERARRLILTRLSFDRDLNVQNFEVTIRLLGGLLSAYQMTGRRRACSASPRTSGRGCCRRSTPRPGCRTCT